MTYLVLFVFLLKLTLISVARFQQSAMDLLKYVQVMLVLLSMLNEVQTDEVA